MKEILVVGGGFAGMLAALNAADEAARHERDIGITVVSKDEYLTIRPRLYEKNPETLRASLRPSFDPVGISLVEGAAREIDTDARSVTVDTSGGEVTLGYDRLILATGSELQTLPVAGVSEHSWNIDTYDAAVALDRHLQKIVQSPDARGHDTFVIVGGGMSGIEFAAEMRNRLREHGDAATAAGARVILIEQADVVGPDFGADPRPVIEQALREADVEVRLGVKVIQVDADGVTLSNGERIEAATTVMTVGLRANGLGGQIPVERDEFGRLPVDEMQRVTGVDGVYATGDIARAHADGERLALMSCQHARTMGKYAGYNAVHDLLGLAPRPYRQADYSTTLDLGNFGAVITTGWDRKVKATGAEAKARKTMINTQLIYPPQGDREEILAASRIDPQTGR